MKPTPRPLVINVDDAGFAPEGDLLILRAVEAGAVRSVSLAATGASAPDFAKKVSALTLPHRVGVGLHFDLVEAPLLGGPYRTLGHERGQKEAFWQRAASGAVDYGEVADEARLQWERLESWGLQPDHLDGHTHIQLFPAVLEGLAQGLGDKEIHLRFPWPGQPPIPGSPAFPGPLLTPERFAELRATTRWRATLPFRGFTFSTSPRLETLEQALLGSHPDGASKGPLELMVHFGGWSERPFPSSDDRRREYELLTDPCLPTHLNALGFRPHCFGEFP